METTRRRRDEGCAIAVKQGGGDNDGVYIGFSAGLSDSNRRVDILEVCGRIESSGGVEATLAEDDDDER